MCSKSRKGKDTFHLGKRSYDPVRATPGQLDRMLVEWNKEGRRIFGGVFIPSRAEGLEGAMRAMGRALLELPIGKAAAALGTTPRVWRETLQAVGLYEEHKKVAALARRGGRRRAKG
jgi:hypothetical protein